MALTSKGGGRDKRKTDAGQDKTNPLTKQPSPITPTARLDRHHRSSPFEKEKYTTVAHVFCSIAVTMTLNARCNRFAACPHRDLEDAQPRPSCDNNSSKQNLLSAALGGAVTCRRIVTRASDLQHSQFSTRRQSTLHCGRCPTYVSLSTTFDAPRQRLPRPPNAVLLRAPLTRRLCKRPLYGRPLDRLRF